MPAITNTLPVQPAVKIIVDGLFVLCLNDETGEATLGVYEYSANHRFSVRISEKVNGSEDALPSNVGSGGSLVRKLDDQNEIVTGDISITISKRAPLIQTYHHPDLVENDFITDARDESRISGDRENFRRDFRWVMDLEGSRFYGRELKVVPGVINRRVRINQGILYTEKYVARIIKQAYKETGKILGKTFPEKYYFVATQMGIAIEALRETETLVISYGNESARKLITLLPPGENSYYEIYASNNCSISNVDRECMLNDTRAELRLSDFQFYYNLIDLPAVDRLDLGITPGEGSNSFPCDMIHLGGHSDLPLGG
jgi:hypothetical protein